MGSAQQTSWAQWNLRSNPAECNGIWAAKRWTQWDLISNQANERWDLHINSAERNGIWAAISLSAMGSVQQSRCAHWDLNSNPAKRTMGSEQQSGWVQFLPFSKILESLMYRWLLSYLNTHNIAADKWFSWGTLKWYSYIENEKLYHLRIV